MNDGITKVRWTNLNVHQLDEVFRRLNLSNFLTDVFDKRLTRIEDLGKKQLIEECKRNNLDSSGLKKTLIERLITLHGQDHLVCYTMY